VETQHLEADELIFELQVYFGFTHCPDICPDELDKMALMYDKVTEACGKVLLPIMITCDPARDTPKVLKEYLKEFHPEFIGLTGDYEQIKQTCKAYRVYFSTPSSVKPGEDYLVDHSIYFYLMGTLHGWDLWRYGSTVERTCKTDVKNRSRRRFRRGHRPQFHGRPSGEDYDRSYQGLGEAAQEGDKVGLSSL
tara:strand:- start:29972 stop:30550 length:579 start_codon:yes stop_codon:yes gene_type:complete